MAYRKSIPTLERLYAAALAAAGKAVAEETRAVLEDTGGRFPHELRCEYAGVPPGTRLTSKTSLEFQ